MGIGGMGGSDYPLQPIPYPLEGYGAGRQSSHDLAASIPTSMCLHFPWRNLIMLKTDRVT